MIKRRIGQIYGLVQGFFKVKYLGFIKGHSYLRPDEIAGLRKYVGVADDDLVERYEQEFSNLIGDGDCIAYATARMGFFDLMRSIGVGKNPNDEVVLLGFTCAVMVNAVHRVGAKPTFSDVDPNTFGSSLAAIEAVVSKNTRMVVAQHSFGIPCEIEPIAAFCAEKNIFLLEDCALSLGSKWRGKTLGNFGDAALFSTDHTKPINTLSGGLIYTRNVDLANNLYKSKELCESLSSEREEALWKRFLFEQKNCTPSRFGRVGLFDFLFAIQKKIFGRRDDFLEEDSGLGGGSSYPYPAKLPPFLAALGLIEVSRWHETAKFRKLLLSNILRLLKKFPVGAYLPNSYLDVNSEIVPLRIAWVEPDHDKVSKILSKRIHIAWTWFKAPIIATNESIENMGYKFGSCPNSEKVGPQMINLPCNLSASGGDILVKALELSLPKD